jgi:hypothetical protein
MKRCLVLSTIFLSLASAGPLSYNTDFFDQMLNYLPFNKSECPDVFTYAKNTDYYCAKIKYNITGITAINKTKSTWAKIASATAKKFNYTYQSQPTPTFNEGSNWTQRFTLNTTLYELTMPEILDEQWLFISLSSNSQAAQPSPQTPTSTSPVVVEPSKPNQPVVYGNFLYVLNLDPISDEDRSLITVSSQDSTDKLFFRCANLELEIFVASTFLNLKESVPVVFRFDKNQPIQQTWDISTSGTAAFVRDTKYFVQLALPSSTLVIRLTKYSGEKITSTFSMVGFAEAIRNLKCAQLALKP